MINSILDTDLYKLTMQQAALELFPSAIAEYQFINRGIEKFNTEFYYILLSKIKDTKYLCVSQDEIKWLGDVCPFFKPSYLAYLKNYRFDPNQVTITINPSGELNLSIAGPWHQTILWEVPLLALISETYFEIVDKNWTDDYNQYKEQTELKMASLDVGGPEFTPISFRDYGTRRRRNFETQNIVVLCGKNKIGFKGTSNVLLSKIHNLIPGGTMAHEWFMGNSVLEGLRNANYYALHNWVRVYGSDLGIALTDTYGLDTFLNNFNMRLSKLYDGIRQDSGNPFVFIDKMVAHYKRMKIDPMSKTAVFSDGLDMHRAIEIAKYAHNKIRTSFGIGTNFTNDFAFCNSKPLNIVIKMSKMNGIPVVKLSDEPNKACGDKDALRVAKWTFYKEPL